MAKHMTEKHTGTCGVLYLAVCAALPAQGVQDFVLLAQEALWDVCVFATPHALAFIDVPVLETMTGYPVRSEYKAVGTSDIFPPMDAMVVAPMTLNTTTKWAQANADNLVLSQLCKALGLRLPLVAAPCITTPFANHPAFPQSIALLQQCGVRILYDPVNYPAPKIVPWETILTTLHEVTDRHRPLVY